MSNLARTNTTAMAIGVEQALIMGDLAKLTPGDRLDYYQQVCRSTGLNPLTQPFAYITLNGKLTLYARKDATDQLRKLHGVSIAIVSRDRLDDVYIVTARATLPDGRSDESVGAVTISNLKGDALANALMKCETKSKRRVTLSICGLGWLDETELSTIPDARPVAVNMATGEIVGQGQPGQDEPAYRRKLWRGLAMLVNEAKQLGLSVQAAERVQMAEESSNADIIAVGRQLRAAIEATREEEAERRVERVQP